MNILIGMAVAMLAQEPMRVPVFVDHAGDDIVGQRLKYQLNQGLTRSATLSSTTSSERAAILVHLSTMGSPAGENAQTIYSVTVLLRDPEGLDGHLDSYVAFCGADVLADCAESIISGVDDQRSMILEALAGIEEEEPQGFNAAF